MELLSVIVPIYNAQAYLVKCIDSILNQTYQNIQVILVDDGSTDDSGKICDRYARQDERVSVIHKQNGGLLAARKSGVAVADGEYITFVDSDDWIESDMYHEMMGLMLENAADLCVSGTYSENALTGEIVFQDTLVPLDYYHERNIREIYPYLFFRERDPVCYISSAVWNKIFKKSELVKVLDVLSDDIEFGEDAAISFTYIVSVHSIIITHKSWYHYMNYGTSMCRTTNFDEFRKIAVFQKNMEDVFGTKGMWAFMKSQIDAYIKVLVCIMAKNCYQIDLSAKMYLFPFDKVPVGKRVLIYGAGNVGWSYVQCLNACNYAEEIVWVDQNSNGINNRVLPVENTAVIPEKKVDYAVIAIANESVANGIREELIHRWEMPCDRVIWVKPRFVYPQ